MAPSYYFNIIMDDGINAIKNPLVITDDVDGVSNDTGEMPGRK